MTNPLHQLEMLDAGIFAKKTAQAITATALSTVAQDGNAKTGVVTITLEFKRIQDSDQVHIKHTLKYSKPTKRGKQAEEDTTHSVAHVATTGELSINAYDQRDLFEQQPTKLRGVK